MNRFLIRIVPFTILLFTITYFIRTWSNNDPKPKPVDGETHIVHEVMDDAREERVHLEKKKWKDAMHKAAPGTNWEQIEAKNRIQNYATISKRRSSNSTIESLANGHLEGEWKERGSLNQSGRILVATYDKTHKNIYVASQGGTIFKGTSDGKNWQPLNDNLNIPGAASIDVFPINSTTQRLFVASNKEVFYSDDDGLNWLSATGISNVQGWGSIRKTVRLTDANNTIYALIQEWDNNNWNEVISLYKSIDNGTSFQQVYTLPSSTSGPVRTQDIYSSIDGDSVLYILEQGKVKSITASQNAPTLISTLPSTPQSNALLTGSLNNGNSYLYAYIDQDVYLSRDNGSSWVFKGNVGVSPFRRNSFAASSDHPNKIFFGGVEVWVSSDTGSTWNKVNGWADYYGDVVNMLHADIPGIFTFRDENNVEKQYICTDGGVYISDNQLQTVKNLSLKGLNASQYYSIYTNRNDPSFIYAGSQDQGFQRSNSTSADSILDFEQTISGDYAHLTSSDGGKSLWFLYPGFVAYNDNAKFGIWDETMDFNGINSYWLPPMIADPSDNKIAYLAGEDVSGNPKIHKLTYNFNGINAQEMSFNFNSLGNGKLSAMSISTINNDHRYVLTDDGKFYYSDNGGTSYVARSINNGPGAHYFYGATIYASEIELGKVYIAGSGYSNPGAWVSYDHGQTFTQITDGLPQTLIYQLTANEEDSLIFAASEAGPLVFSEQDNKWYNFSGVGAPNQVYWSVEYLKQEKIVRYGTHGRGIWDFAILDTTSVDTNNNVTEINNSNNYLVFPNPTVDVIHIQSKNATSRIESLKIYSIMGKEVYNQSNVVENTQIDVSNFANGTYIIHITANGKSSISKFVKN